MRVLVTGATGFVGSHLADLLIARGHQVRVTLRKTSKLAWLEGKPLERVESDLREGHGLDAACDGMEVVYHVAGVINAPRERDYRAGNWLATKRIVEAAARQKVRRFVHVSSLAAGGPSPDGAAVTEEMPCRPVSIYGRSKLEGEREALKPRHPLEVAVVRPPVVYGPRDNGLLDMFKVLAAGVKPRFGAEKWISIVHALDLAEGIVAAGEHPAAAGEIFYLCNEASHRQTDVMEMILQALGRRAITLGLPDRVVKLAAAVAEDTGRFFGVHSMFHRDKAVEMTQAAWVCSPAKAARLLGWKAVVPMSRGIPETLAWYRDQKLI